MEFRRKIALAHEQALGLAAVWGIYGIVYFLSRSKDLGREVILTQKPA